MLPEVSASWCAYPLDGKGEGAHSHSLPTRHLSGDGRTLSNQICARICAQDAAGRLETRGTQRARHGRPDVRPPRSVQRPETMRDGRDRCRMAHNPEVAGSNPAPATKARGPLSNRKRASGPRFVNRLCNVALVRVASRVHAPTFAAWSSRAEPVTSNEVSNPLTISYVGMVGGSRQLA